MIIESVQEASQALGMLKSTLMQAGKVAGSGVVAGGGGSSLAHDIGSTSSTTAPQSSTSSGGSSEPREIIRVNNMNEFFEKTDFGRTLKPKSRKTPYIQDGCPIYEITEKVGNPHLGKGDFCHLDYSHRDHLEVFTHQGKAKCVLNLD